MYVRSLDNTVSDLKQATLRDHFAPFCGICWVVCATRPTSTYVHLVYYASTVYCVTMLQGPFNGRLMRLFLLFSSLHTWFFHITFLLKTALPPWSLGKINVFERKNNAGDLSKESRRLLLLCLSNKSIFLIHINTKMGWNPFCKIILKFECATIFTGPFFKFNTL